jgi:hypothetical protein
MIRKAVLFCMAAVLGLGLMLACGAVSPSASFVPTHPQELGPGRPAFDHTEAFVKDHRFLAGRDANVCAACHAQAFCADCHSAKAAMTPDVKLGNRPDREMPHRADYLTVHRFDGQADPASCFKCHGRGNNASCITCHA